MSDHGSRDAQTRRQLLQGAGSLAALFVGHLGGSLLDVKRLERRPLSGGGNFRNGSTPYDNLTISVKFSDGIATAEDIRFEGPASRVTLTWGGKSNVDATAVVIK